MKWRYIFFTEDYSAYGTNDEAVAKKGTEWCQIYDAQEGKWLAFQGDARTETQLVVQEYVESAGDGNE